MAKPIKLKLEDLHFQLTKDNFVKCVYKGKNMYNDHYEVVHWELAGSLLGSSASAREHVMP